MRSDLTSVDLFVTALRSSSSSSPIYCRLNWHERVGLTPVIIGYDKRMTESTNGPSRDGDPGLDLRALPADLVAVLESAARLQELVPDAVLVGGSAAALYARHRASFDHDHVVADLRGRFEVVLDALERESGWVTERVVADKIILGDLGGIEAGIRQLVRRLPLEVADVVLPSGRHLRVPTAPETLRVKAYLLVKRNQTRDHLDVAALADRYGLDWAADVLGPIDDYYTDPRQDRDSVASQLIRQLGSPAPKDSRTIRRLASYKQLRGRYHDWATVCAVLGEVAERMVDPAGGRP